MTDDPGVKAALKARCVAELHQTFKAHKGQLIEVKKLMPNVIKSIVMCYKGFCGIHCQINSLCDILGITLLKCTIECFTLLGGGKKPYKF
jgi:hypothetical protein